MSYGKNLDPPLSNGKFFGISKHIPGRMNPDDYVFFEHSTMLNYINAADYVVVITPNDTSSSPLRTIGPLQVRVEIPHVQLDAYAMIYLLPKDNPNLPRFGARLNRGSTYSIPMTNGKASPPGGMWQMHRHGVLVGAI